MPTIGFKHDGLTMPYSLSKPKVINFSEICVLKESDGTETNNLLQEFAIKVANIVSVLPVPVGITTIAFSSGF
ncbi:hypothetical protein GCM10023229_14300 [Flavisolibacter ginsenosidimutans]